MCHFLLHCTLYFSPETVHFWSKITWENISQILYLISSFSLHFPFVSWENLLLCFLSIIHFLWIVIIFFACLLMFRNNGLCMLLLLFSWSVVSDCLLLHGLQHTRLLCLSLSPEFCSDSCPLSQWCYFRLKLKVWC